VNQELPGFDKFMDQLVTPRDDIIGDEPTNTND